MKKKLIESFQGYTDSVQSKLSRNKDKIVLMKPSALRPLVEGLEEKPGFHNLVLETHAVFSGNYHSKHKNSWKNAIKNYLRRSGYYFDVLDKDNFFVDETFKNYCDAFVKEDTQITYLTLLELVSFSERSMDFGSFQIERLTKNELEDLFQNKINEVFYPWAVADVKRLQSYWFLSVKKIEKTPKLGFIHLNLEEIGHVNLEITKHPKAVESALQQLVLFDWQADLWKDTIASGKNYQKENRDKGWFGFDIPFIFTVGDNLLEFPRNVPNLSKLQIEIQYDPQTEDEYEIPAVWIHLNENETDLFKTFMEHVGSLLPGIKGRENGWKFFTVALGYLIKAFFAEGLEQMLWHITTLEALLGDKGEGVTNRLAKRIASILGKNKRDKKALIKRFKDLYDFRSDLVHGNPFKEQVYIGHLREARDLARETILWFLNYLAAIQESIPVNQSTKVIPSRPDIHTLLDMDKKSRDSLSKLMGDLPPAFPYNNEWIK